VTAVNYTPRPEVNYFSQFFHTATNHNTMNSVVNPVVCREVSRVENIPEEETLDPTEEEIAVAAATMAIKEKGRKVSEEQERQWMIKMAIWDLIFQTNKPLENLDEIAVFRLEQANSMAKHSFDYSFIYEREFVEIFKKADNAIARFVEKDEWKKNNPNAKTKAATVEPIEPVEKNDVSEDTIEVIESEKLEHCDAPLTKNDNPTRPTANMIAVVTMSDGGNVIQKHPTEPVVPDKEMDMSMDIPQEGVVEEVMEIIDLAEDDDDFIDENSDPKETNVDKGMSEMFKKDVLINSDKATVPMDKSLAAKLTEDTVMENHTGMDTIDNSINHNNPTNAMKLQLSSDKTSVISNPL
jgi:hypothetical protein